MKNGDERLPNKKAKFNNLNQAQNPSEYYKAVQEETSSGVSHELKLVEKICPDCQENSPD